MNAFLAISAAVASCVPLAVVLWGLRKPPTHRRDHAITARSEGGAGQLPRAGELWGSAMRGAVPLSHKRRV